MLAYVVILGLISMMAPFAIDLYLPAISEVSKSLIVPFHKVELTITVFLAGFTIGQLLFGPLAERLGYRRILTIGISVFTIASLLISKATNIEYLYILRFIQAIGGSSCVIVFPIIKSTFNEHNSQKVISYVMACIVAAPVIAPFIGGQFLRFWDWRVLFVILALFGLITLLASFRLPLKKDQKLDLINIRSAYSHYSQILQTPSVLLPILCCSTAIGGLFTYISGSAFVFLEYFGKSPQIFGLIMSINGLSMIIANLVNGYFLAAHSPLIKIKAGAALMLLSSFIIFLTKTFQIDLFVVVTTSCIFFFSLGLVETNSVILCFKGKTKHGAIAGLLGALQFGVGALGSLMTSYFTTNSPLHLGLTLCLFSSLTLMLILKISAQQKAT